MAYIDLYRRQQLLGVQFEVSDEDIDMFLQYRWTLNANGYPRTYIGKTFKLYAHHLVIPIQPGHYVDHIDRNKLNCKRSNLRLVTPGENVHWRWAENPGRGVRWVEARQRWEARLSKDNKLYNSYHTTKEAALNWRKLKVQELYGHLTTP